MGLAYLLYPEVVDLCPSRTNPPYPHPFFSSLSPLYFISRLCVLSPALCLSGTKRSLLFRELGVWGSWANTYLLHVVPVFELWPASQCRWELCTVMVAVSLFYNNASIQIKAQAHFSASPSRGKMKLMLLKSKRKMSLDPKRPAAAGHSIAGISSPPVADTLPNVPLSLIGGYLVIKFKGGSHNLYPKFVLDYPQ